jgi:hypothetical protein
MRTLGQPFLPKVTGLVRAYAIWPAQNGRQIGFFYEAAGRYRAEDPHPAECQLATDSNQQNLRRLVLRKQRMYRAICRSRSSRLQLA